MEIDAVFKEIGEFGPFQLKVFLSLGLVQIPLAFQQMQNVFVGADQEFYCKTFDGELVKGCLVENNGDSIKKCSSYIYNSSFSSTVSQWDLVCNHAYLKDVVQSVFMFGLLIGALTIAPLSDTYGRLKILHPSMMIQFIAGLCSSFAPTYAYFVFLRFLVGISNGALIVIFTLLMEHIGAPWRGFCSTLYSVFFALGIALFAAMANYVRDWRILSALSALTLVPFVIQLYWLLPESPRWLLNIGRVSAAERILKGIALKNGRPSTIEIKLKNPERSKEQETPEKKESVLLLFTHRAARCMTLIQLYSWFAVSAVYFGLTLNAGSLGGNMYINIALSGLVEIPAYLVTIYTLDSFGRKLSLCCVTLIGGVSCMAILFTPPEFTYRITLLALGGKITISSAYSVLFLYSSELCPTVVRNAGLGLYSVFSRIGGIAVPLIISLGTIYPNSQFAVFGALSFTVGILNFMLPETLNQPLPETFDDLYKKTSHKQRKNA